MSTDDNEIDRLLGLARQADLPDQARLDRVRQRLLPTAAGGSQPPTPQPSPAMRARRVALTSKLVIGLGVVIVAGSVATVALRRQTPAHPADSSQLEAAPVPASSAPQPSAAPTELTQPTQPAPALPEPPKADAPPVHTRPRPASAPKTQTRSQPSAAAEPVDTEPALMRKIVLYMRNGQLDRARSALETLRRSYPQSQMQAEHDRLQRWLSRLERDSSAP